MRAKKAKSFAVNILVSISSIALTLLALEGGARLFWREDNRGGYCTEPHPTFLHRNRPSCEYQLKKTEGSELVSYTINECGHRDPRPCSEYGKDGKNLVIALGDSFTFGAMVQERDTYVRSAETQLKEAGINITYVNAGVGGWDLHQYREALRDVLIYNPKMVTVGLLPNDLYADISPNGIEARARMAVSQDAAAIYDTIYSEQRPSLERLVKSAMQQSRFLDLLTHLLLRNDAIYASIYKRRSGEDSYLTKSYSRTWRQKIEHAATILNEMASESKKANALFAVIVIPQRIQALLAARPEDFPGLDAGSFSREIAAIGESSGFPVIDFLESLKEDSRPTSHYYPVDGHLTPEGQRRLGDFVAEHLAPILEESFKSIPPSSAHFARLTYRQT
ncbi:MAG: SGNH/GDSL hydrolase family protein [Deltaproteobacteria bacterium]|nr:SGNH/GDSL hydrolase family protein [Deltaproteobacteria bacterium]